MSRYDSTSLIDDLCREFRSKAPRQLGYPVFAHDDQNAALAPLLKYMINNLGDPFVGTRFGCNTMDIEQDLIKRVAHWFRLGDPWGYVTSGGTEGNICGVHYGLTKYPQGIIYCSNQSHYSIKKASKLCRASIVEVGSDDKGEIDYNKLYAYLDHTSIGAGELDCPDLPAIIVVNYGTMMTGAIDSVEKILDVVHHSKHCGEVYIHVDAALFGLMLPFVPEAPQINFNKYPIDSISVSGHKFLGVPFPCGMFLSHSHQNMGDVEYIDSRDSTITGSRNGLAALSMAYKIDKDSERYPDKVQRCIVLAEALTARLYDARIAAWRNPYSNVVVFPKPVDYLCEKWQLATSGSIAHAIIMPHVNEDTIDEFTRDMAQQREYSGELLKIG